MLKIILPRLDWFNSISTYTRNQTLSKQRYVNESTIVSNSYHHNLPVFKKYFAFSSLVKLPRQFLLLDSKYQNPTETINYLV